MSITRKIFLRGTLLGAVNVAYGGTIPTGAKRTVVAASLCNTTAAPIICTIGIGTNDDPKNILISAKAIGAGETYLCPELINKELDPGDAFQALGDGISFSVNGFEIV